MATKLPLVMSSSGDIQQLQSGDQVAVLTSQLDVRLVTNAEATAPLVIGTPVYVFIAGAVKRAQANALATARVFGLWVDTTTAAAGTGNVGMNGLLVATTVQWDTVTGQTGGLTSGATYFVDPTTVGKLTASAPTTAGQVVSVVGLALSLTEMEINIARPILL